MMRRTFLLAAEFYAKTDFVRLCRLTCFKTGFVRLCHLPRLCRLMCFKTGFVRLCHLPRLCRLTCFKTGFVRLCHLPRLCRLTCFKTGFVRLCHLPRLCRLMCGEALPRRLLNKKEWGYAPRMAFGLINIGQSPNQGRSPIIHSPAPGEAKPRRTSGGIAAASGGIAASTRLLWHSPASLWLLVGALLLLLVSYSSAVAQPKRLVIIKCDGLPADMVDRLARQRDPQSGKSVLPWIDHIFYQRGARLSNFYVRGMSLSAPSWSLLETGQHLQIKGNVEFDRYTLHSYDYLNFFPLYMAGIVGARIDMPAVEVLDSLGLPLLTDAYAHDERYTTMSLFMRGPRYATFQSGLQNKLLRPPKELFDEWTMGLEVRNVLTDQLLREMLQKLANPKIRYLDLFLADFDHIAHHNNDQESQIFVLKQMDAVIGQVWTTIQKSPFADETALVIVSDHGFKTGERIYSQGYNLVKLLC